MVRIRDLDDGEANRSDTDSVGLDRTGLDEAERVSFAHLARGAWPGIGARSGRIISAPFDPNSTGTLADSVLYLCPIFVPFDISDDVRMVTRPNTGGSAGSSWRMGLWLPDNATYPNEPETLIADFGTVTPTSATTMYTSATTVTLRRGLNWMGIASQGTVHDAVLQICGNNGDRNVFSVFHTNWEPQYWGRAVSSVSGAFAANISSETGSLVESGWSKQFIRYGIEIP